jgi:hypothetical protein
VYAQGVFILDNHSIYLDSDGHIHVVGEVQNLGSINVKDVRITVDFLNKNNETLDIVSTYAQLENIPPNMKAPWEVESEIVDFSSYNRHFVYPANYNITTESRTWTILLLSNSSHIDGSGYLHILGEIKNNGTQPSQSTRVVATCYGNGRVRAVGAMDVNQTVIAAGDNAQFDLVINRYNAPVTSYDLQVISNGAILIPEFSSTAIIFTLAYLILLLFIMRCKILSKNTLKFS